jgi:hypothetical protein
MRHECVSTTEKYYINVDADSTAAMLAGLLQPKGDTLGDTPPEVTTGNDDQTNKNNTGGGT